MTSEWVSEAQRIAREAGEKSWDAALEEAAQVNERIACSTRCEHEGCKDLLCAAERIRARKGRK